MSEQLSQLLERLEGLGFYRYALPGHIAELKQAACATGYVFGGAGGLRDYDADAEDLVEGGVHVFLRRVLSFLEAQGIHITTVVEDFNDKGYTITINGRAHHLYTEKDLGFRTMGEIWKQTTVRTYTMVNTWLKEVGSNERIFGLYGGHDNRAIFLTNQMYEALRLSTVLPKQEMPIPMPDL